jgi:hypothetical protein
VLTQKNYLLNRPLHKNYKAYYKAYYKGITGDLIEIKQLSLLNVKMRVWG